MSTLLMRPPKETRLLAREGKLHLSAVDPQDRLARISHRTNKTRHCKCAEPQGCLQEVVRVGLREILCDMLVTSVWEDGDGSLRKEGKNGDENHNSAPRA